MVVTQRTVHVQKEEIPCAWDGVLEPVLVAADQASLAPLIMVPKMLLSGRDRDGLKGSKGLRNPA